MAVKDKSVKDKIKVGILVNSLILEEWKREIIKEINASSYAEVVLFIKRKEPNPLTKSEKLWKYRGSIFYKIIETLDAFLSKKLTKKHVNAFAKKDYRDSNVPVIEVEPKTTKFSDIIVDEDLDKIKDYDLDIILRFGFRILKGGILNSVSKQGVWSFHHGDNKVNRGGPPGFWEVLQGWKETGCILQRLSEDLDGGYVLNRTWVATYKYNIRENKNRIYWRAIKIIPRLLKELHEEGTDVFYSNKKVLNPANDFYTRKIYKAPGNWQGLLLLIKYIRIVVAQIIDVTFYKDQWFLLYRKGKQTPETSFRRMKKITSKKSMFWADPFLVHENNRDYIFVEEYDWSISKGHISVLDIVDNKVDKITKVIDNDYHFSYPFIFQYEGDYYMIPETASNRTIELYKCDNFPYEWSFQKNLFENIAAVDTTLFYHNELWWLFTSVDETAKSTKHDELFVFYATNPITGNWTPHKKNPVITDAKVARPAGNLFVSDGKMFRPSQNCTGIYGSSININEIKVLTKDEYKEQLIDNLKPDWDKKLRGIHTINFNEKITVLDGFEKVSKFF
ncbi:hypothetical protein [Winogradskyella sp. 3972H.M.0a.05]|uniref:glucosamine inositolphosphorylceramide transferase family protein n=1 Tax=Winogradskyella sp. 3972H.M.0a.05 TaxID=2950277 RepID=UPI00339AD11A